MTKFDPESLSHSDAVVYGNAKAGYRPGLFRQKCSALCGLMPAWAAYTNNPDMPPWFCSEACKSAGRPVNPVKP